MDRWKGRGDGWGRDVGTWRCGEVGFFSRWSGALGRVGLGVWALSGWCEGRDCWPWCGCRAVEWFVEKRGLGELV